MSGWTPFQFIGFAAVAMVYMATGDSDWLVAAAIWLVGLFAMLLGERA